MKTMYRLCHWNDLYSSDRIDEREVESDTPHFVKVKGSRHKEAKVGDGHSWHDTRLDAAQHWVSICKTKRDGFALDLAVANEALSEAQKLLKECQ